MSRTLWLLLVLALPPVRAADPLAPLRFLEGSCWQGRFPDGQNADTHCYQGFYGQAFLRDTHLVWGHGSDYRGQTIYHRDGDTGRILYRYWNVAGGVSDGEARVDGDRLAFPDERYTAEDGTSIVMRSFLERSGPDSYVATSERRQGEDWELLWRMVFVRIGPADRSPDLARVPQLDRSAVERCAPLQNHDFAFTASVDGNAQLYLYEAGGPRIRRLTDHPSQDHVAGWSPDGGSVVFQSMRDGDREIYRSEIEPWNPRNLTEHPQQDLLPDWAPDGRRLVFFSSRDTGWDREGPLGGHLFVADADGGDVRRLLETPFGSTTSARWSPDGRRVVYTRFGEDRRGIWELDVARGTERRLIAGDVGGATWSPDGRRLAFYRSRDDGADLFVLDLDREQERRLTGGAGHYYDADWSPDGSVLLVTASADGERFDLHCIAADGSFDVPVVDDPFDARSAAWRPQRGPR